LTSVRRLTVAFATLSILAPAPRIGQATHTIDPEHSTLRVSVGKSGLFGAFGHDHAIDAARVSGTVEFDAVDPARDAVNFAVATSSLRVVDPGVSASDREKVQSTMLGPAVLDAERFPEITFTSTSVSPSPSASAGPEWTGLDLAGVLRLHGVERPLDVPVQLRAEGTTVHVHGEATIRQTDYGMTPVTAVGGTVRVKDQVKITFDILAVPRGRK